MSTALRKVAVATCRWLTTSCPALPQPCPCSSHSVGSDPLLAFVASQAASQPGAAAAQRQPSSLAAGSSGDGSGAYELRTDARVWEVQWSELTILRAIGRGSFGSVYLAEWNQVAVAVKVLISTGECGS